MPAAESGSQPITPGDCRPEHVRTYLQLTALLDEIAHTHPEVSARLRLRLMRARSDGHLGSLDASSFYDDVAAARRSQLRPEGNSPNRTRGG